MPGPADPAQNGSASDAMPGMGRAVLIVERSRLTETVARVLAELKPRDLAVSDAPVEQVVGRLFLEGVVGSGVADANPTTNGNPGSAT